MEINSSSDLSDDYNINCGSEEYIEDVEEEEEKEYNEKDGLLGNGADIINEIKEVIGLGGDGEEVPQQIVKPKKTLSDHKYKKDLVLIYISLSLLILSPLIYLLFIPTVFLNYVQINFPNLTQDEIQSKATFYKSFSDSLPYVFMFLFGPFLAVLSDKFGRKLMLYYGIIMNILDMCSCFVSIKTNNLLYYYVMHSLAGTSNVSLAAVLAYIADISHEDLVPVLYSFSGIGMGISVVIGPLIFVATNLNVPNNQVSLTTLYVAVGIMFFNLMLVPFLKESLDIAKENKKIVINKSSTSNPFKLIKLVFTRNGYVAFVILLYASLSYTIQDISSTYYYHNQLMYGWGSKQNGIFMAFMGVLMIIWSGFIIPFFLKKYSERKLISVGFLIGFATHIVYSFAVNQWMWIGISLIGSFVINNLNLLQSVVSRATPNEIKGSILTGCRSVGALAGFFGSLASSNIYRYFTSDKAPIKFPGAPYFIDSFILLGTFFFSLAIWRKYSNPNPLIKKSNKKKQQSSQPSDQKSIQIFGGDKNVSDVSIN